MRPLIYFRDFTAGSYRRGSALLFTLMGVMVLSTAGLSLLAQTVAAVRLSRVQRDSSQAFNLAESGAEAALIWLHGQSAPPVGSAPFPLYTNTTLGPGTYSVSIDPDDDNFSSTSQLPRYMITATGQVGARQETVQMYVQLKSFGNWAYFNNIEDPSLWYISGMQFNGPVHSNNADGNLLNIDWTGSTSPIFNDQLSVVANRNNYQPRAPVGDAEYRNIYKQGIAGLSLSSFNIPLPSNSTLQKNAAWGNNTGFPTATGVNIPKIGSTTSAGIYIVGDSSMAFSTDAAHPAWQVITIVQGSTTTKLTVQRDTNQTLVEVNGGPATTLSGTTNGAIYTTGNVTNLQGTLADSVVSGSTITGRNAFTLATDLSNSKNVTITNNLKYNTQPDRTKPWNDPVNLKAATLGIVSRNVVLDGAVGPQDLTVDAMMMAGANGLTSGSLYVSNYSSRSPSGNLHVLGGLIEVTSGVTGSYNPTTGTLINGYLEHYQYDYRLATNPPPFYPTTNGYQKLSWQRTSAGATGSY